MSDSFHAHHSPMGAHSSLTCGMFHARGGAGMELSGPASGAVYAGYEDGESTVHYLPFFEVQDDEKSRYVDTQSGEEGNRERIFTENEITRTYRWATDSFTAGPFTLEIITPFFGLPDPADSTRGQQKFASCPVVFVRVRCDNTQGRKPVRAFFGLQGEDAWTKLDDEGPGDAMKGVKAADRIGLATLDDVDTFVHFTVPEALDNGRPPSHFYLGPTAGGILNVDAGTCGEALFAVGFFKECKATYGVETRYWYTRYFARLEDTLAYALDNVQAYLKEAQKRDAELENAGLNSEQKFLVSHATRSYYGSTEWLDEAGKPRWVVNEGEYRMMNTFDLTVDMLFYEMRFNPWTVRNVLEQFVAEYSYYDEVFQPGYPETAYEGGISFCHDMGVRNQFSPFGHSSYEQTGIDRFCFSHMTCEQLVNWICCAGVYVAQTDDREFLSRYRGTVYDCLTSLLHRDHSDPAHRTGIMSFESSRTLPGGEITTYDSLDHSLGQARQNLYLAVKSWSAYLALEWLFGELNMPEAREEAGRAAGRCAESLVQAYDSSLGFIPAVLEGDSRSAIIPAIEGLVFPKEMGLSHALDFDGAYATFLKTVKQHFENIFIKGTCLYEDNGWKLSSTADNSWMSKICLCQHVARTVLGIDFGDAGPAADHAHAEWERNGSTFNACSDQFHSGVAKASLYYPRIVTNILWLSE